MGYAGFNGKVGDKQHHFGQVYRFKPDGSELNSGRTSNNTWGLGFENNDVFISANNQSSVYIPIPRTQFDRFEDLINPVLCH